MNSNSENKSWDTGKHLIPLSALLVTTHVYLILPSGSPDHGVVTGMMIGAALATTCHYIWRLTAKD